MSLIISMPLVKTTSRSEVDTMIPSGNAPATEGESNRNTLLLCLWRFPELFPLLLTRLPELVTNIISLTLLSVRTRFDIGLHIDTTTSLLVISLLIMAQMSPHFSL
uniref:Uncharacterized protein n=1 Tax=Cacopsylla melanoneura TaxID=428564 RepID=A0A8D8ZSP7_9HEMI